MELFTNGDKVNFVDENNVFVGYDLGSRCCEHAGWCVLLNEDDFEKLTSLDVLSQPTNFDGWQFDITYQRSIEKDLDDIDDKDVFAVQFRMTKENKEQFLILFNAHNGYYDHGFVVKNEDEVIHKGRL